MILLAAAIILIALAALGKYHGEGSAADGIFGITFKLSLAGCIAWSFYWVFHIWGLAACVLCVFTGFFTAIPASLTALALHHQWAHLAPIATAATALGTAILLNSLLPTKRQG